MRSIRVVDNANSKSLRTVNVFAGPTGGAGEVETCTQIGPTAAAQNPGSFETVQGLTGPTAGVENVIIDGFTATA